ncbi:hypothetical protein RD792_006978 [Penstemon davidsonii]|uniref:Uncharacterized protein n=1 Tax=Penstemon davidsonii TaxID=160366 RepID=A0ABR0D561_9LAMI|nr:hypothetical protein RD792_006978 [Penstemon davidsonii]
MDSHYFGYNVTGPTFSSIPTRLFKSLKFDSRNSPNPSFSTPYNTEIESQIQQFSADNLSESIPSSNYNDNLQQSRPSIFSRQNSLLVRSNEPFLQNVNSNQNIRQALLNLESALMDPDDDTLESTNVNFVLKTNPHSLKHLLIACARALFENKLVEFEKLVELARASVSITGEPIQRLGAYMVEGLIARKEFSGTNIYHTLKCNMPPGKELLSYMHILYEICPYMKFGYMAANGAIAEACKNEDYIHIVDFQIAQGTQWVTLLQALASRPSGAPRVRITGIDDPVSKYARGENILAVGKRLAEISETFNISVEFHAVPVFALDITREMLDIRPGEALAVNFPLQLHHTPDESVDVLNPRDGLLRMVKSLSPKVVTLVEQESNTNTAPFVQRFVESLDFYSAMFESIDATMPRDRKERINIEQHCLARDIVNIIACEGKERVERHELFGKWSSRFIMAGFRQFPLSTYVNSVIRGLLRCYSEHYTLLEKDGGMLLGWKDRNLISASAWH